MRTNPSSAPHVESGGLSEQRREDDRRVDNGTQFTMAVGAATASGVSRQWKGYAQDVPGGFQITHKGMDFVREYFKN